MSHSRAEVTVAPGYAGVDLFEMPALLRAEATVLARVRASDLPGAEARLAALAERYPMASRLDLLRAVLAAAAGDRELTITALLAADKKGAPGLPGLLSQPLFARITGDTRLAGLAEHPPPAPRLPTPAAAQGGRVTAAAAAGTWDRERERIRLHLIFPRILKTHAFAHKPPPGPLKDLQRLVARGFAAGNAGDLYDNRDRGHSALRQGPRTQLTHVAYGPGAKAAGLDYGVNFDLLFQAPTFGNSSTAVIGPSWRSQPRYALTRPGGATELWELYANNHLYVFPEHRDHDSKYGDVFPAHVPYVLISQGSSGSDKPLLQAVQVILAAFKPAVKASLVEASLIAPTVQQVFRRAQTGVTDTSYLSAKAHPTVFQGKDIDLARAIQLAQAITPDTIPPRVHLRLLAEPPPAPGVFADGLSEVLFDTPGAIARAWRGLGTKRRYRLAAQGFDANGRALTYHWRVIRGDAARIQLEPLDSAGTQIRITIPWHNPGAAPGQPQIRVPRVDIAAFAHNGAQVSAPAFFSLVLPAHQRREHDADGRTVVMRPLASGAYADPLIWPKRVWTDRFHYGPEGTLIGWTRTRQGGQEARFTAQGYEILTADSLGRPRLLAKIAYPISRTKEGHLIVTETPTGQRFRVSYRGPSDRAGELVPMAE